MAHNHRHTGSHVQKDRALRRVELAMDSMVNRHTHKARTPVLDTNGGVGRSVDPYGSFMASEAEKELERIERELDAKAPGGKSPVKAGGQSSPADPLSKNNHLDAVIVGAVLLTAIAFITMLGESLSPKQKTQLTAASMGGAAGLLAGYGVGRIKP